MMAKRKVKNNPMWDEVIKDLDELAETMKAGGMEAVKKKYRVTSFEEVQARAATLAKVQAIREKVRVDQPTFAEWFGVRLQTLQAWESGTRKPTGPARRLLDEIDRDPKYWRQRLKTPTVAA